MENTGKEKTAQKGLTTKKEIKICSSKDSRLERRLLSAASPSSATDAQTRERPRERCQTCRVTNHN